MTALVTGLLAGLFAAWSYRLLPEKWVCDYGETPGVQHEAWNRHLAPWQCILCGVLCAGCTLGAQRVFTAPWMAPLLAMLFAALLLCAVSDLQFQILPDELLLFCAALGLLLLFASGSEKVHRVWWMALLSAAAGFAAMWLVQWLGAKLYKTEAMGFGDVKLCALAGWLCGFGGLGVCLLCAVFGAAIVFLVLRLLGKISAHSLQAFGPFLIFGIMVALCLYPEWHAAVNAYLALF